MSGPRKGSQSLSQNRRSVRGGPAVDARGRTNPKGIPVVFPKIRVVPGAADGPHRAGRRFETGSWALRQALADQRRVLGHIAGVVGEMRGLQRLRAVAQGVL